MTPTHPIRKYPKWAGYTVVYNIPPDTKGLAE
jgi:hypothetical protein